MRQGPRPEATLVTARDKTSSCLLKDNALVRTRGLMRQPRQPKLLRRPGRDFSTLRRTRSGGSLRFFAVPVPELPAAIAGLKQWSPRASSRGELAPQAKPTFPWPVASRREAERQEIVHQGTRRLQPRLTRIGIAWRLPCCELQSLESPRLLIRRRALKRRSAQNGKSVGCFDSEEGVDLRYQRTHSPGRQVRQLLRAFCTC